MNFKFVLPRIFPKINSLFIGVVDSGKGVCVDPGKGKPFWGWGARPSRKGRGAAVGSRQWRRRDVAVWPPRRETDSPQLQETVMHRVSVIVHCTAIV